MNKVLLVLCLMYSICCTGQVNLQTGAAEASFPLYEYNDAKSRLSTGMSLNYISGNGLKANDVASSVGTGWALAAGGVISRIQHGEPDDQLFANPNNWADYKEMMAFGNTIDMCYANGYMFTDIPASTPFPNEACYSPIFTNVYPFEYKPDFEDREQDVYMFQFNGRMGHFIIGKNREAKLLDDSKLKISFALQDMESQKVRTRITSFTITDESGIQYRFAEKELSDLFKYTQAELVNNYKVVKGTDLHKFALNKIVTRWFLSEIRNTLTGEAITFQYDTYNVDMDGPRHLLKQVISGVNNNPQQMLVEKIRRSTKRISTVTFPDKHKISFNYAAAVRIDEPGDKALTEINILYNNNLLYGYRFSYGYFFKHEIKPYDYPFPDAEKRYARLCLTDFRKFGTGGSSVPPYIFTYFMAPQPDATFTYIAPAFTLYTDHWGYYNPDQTSITENANGYPVYSFGPKSVAFDNSTLWESFGVLKSIRYPEGGSLEFEYEHNQAAGSPYVNQKNGGIRVARTNIRDGSGQANDMVKRYKYIKEDGSTSGWGFEMPKYTVTNSLRQYKVDGNASSGSNIKEMSSDFIGLLLSTRMSSMASGLLHGSLMNVQTLVRAGFQMIIVYVVAEIITNIFSPAYKDYSVAVYKSDNYNLINSLPQLYSRVEVIDEGLNNGKVVYEFTDPSVPGFGLRDPGPLSAPHSSGRMRYAHWLYGLPRSVTWKNNVNQNVRKIEHTYNPIVREINSNDFLSRSYEVNTNVAIGAFKHNLSEFNSSYLNTETYYPIQGRAELTKSIETVYNNSGGSISTETSFTYSPYNFMLRTVSKKDSKGSISGITTYYTSDYDVPGTINQMKDSNMIGMPVSVNMWIQDGQGAPKKLVDAMVTDYEPSSNADIRPSQVFRSELAAPLVNGVPESSTYLISYKDYSWLKPQQVMIYDNGNLAQTTRVSGNFSKSVIYGYENRLPIAEVTNATKDEIKYTSFESEDIWVRNSGGWVYGGYALTEAFCPTGKACYMLSVGPVQSGPIAPLAKTTIVSLWTSGSQIALNVESNLSQIAPSKTGPSINGWTYYEYELPIGFASAFNISGNGLLDELRLCPKNAQMMTYTYSPGIGKTSTCDDNNRITRYEYDSFGRLAKERDQFYNLLKTYEYNYKQ
jgi:hypothetical protein